jgi:hypothetical protein
VLSSTRPRPVKVLTKRHPPQLRFQRRPNPPVRAQIRILHYVFSIVHDSCQHNGEAIGRFNVR